MRRLNQRGDSEAVIRAFEGGYVASTEAALGEYVKALALVDRLDNGALIRTLQVCFFIVLNLPSVWKLIVMYVKTKPARWVETPLLAHTVCSAA